MDILYYIGKGSHHNNQELRYSLRALEKHCKDIGDVWIVGNRPHFLNNNIKYLWEEDNGQWWQNAYRKTMSAINAGISENFLLMNDDFFMFRDFYAAKYPRYHKGEIMDKAGNKYQEAIVNTKHVLQSLSKPTLHYGVHCPMRINAKKYKQLARFYEGEYAGLPLSARCLYGNLFCKGTKVSDCKGENWRENITKCFSSKDWVSNDIWHKLEDLYAVPSKWEKEDG